MNGVVRGCVGVWVSGQFLKLGAAKFCGGGMNRNSGMLPRGKHLTCGPKTTVLSFL